MRSLRIALCLIAAVPFGLRLPAQALRVTHAPNIANGRLLYTRGCIACHGTDGKGADQTATEFKRPHTFPDFSRCEQTTPETNIQYKATIEDGGRARGFSRIMPSFRGLLSSDQIDDIIAYIRTLCTQQGWPRGELNLPLALVTEKAFPEDELVVTGQANASGSPGVTIHAIHEQTFGKRDQLEVDVPWDNADENHAWSHHIGDITLGWKHVVFSNLRTGSILSVQGGIIPPSGSSKLGGNGTTVFEPFAAFDQLFPTNTWVQFQMGADLPRHPEITPKSVYSHTALGQTWASDQRLGRQWSPMIEFLANRDLEDGAQTDWDILPGMQVTISQRQHIRAAVGYRKPVTDTAGRTPELDFYVLWDWFDGAFWKGWR